MRFDRWAFPVVPCEGELLSSFLVRSAFAHGTSPYIFCNLFWPGRAIWTRDIDRDPDQAWLSSLGQASGVPLEQLQTLSLAALRQRLSGTPQVLGNTPLLLSLGIYHRTRRLHALQYCPLCLAENRPWYRKMWRLAFRLTCADHGCFLRDGCPACDRPLIPHRIAGPDLSACHWCRKQLSRVPPDDSERLSSPLLRLQHDLTAGLETSLLSFNGVEVSALETYTTIRTLLSISACRQVQRALRRCFGMDDVIVGGTAKLVFEHARWITRMQWLDPVAHWVTGWPDTFHEGAAASRLTQLSFVPFRVPSILSQEVAKLHIGTQRKRVYVPVLCTPEMRRLWRRSPEKYRVIRAERLLRAAGEK